MSAGDGPWDSTGASPPSTYAGSKKYFHVILIGGGGIGSMTVPSDYVPSTSANTNPTPGDFLSLTQDYTGANGGASGGYVELYIDRANAGATWNNITLTAGTGAQRYGGAGANPSPSGYKDGTRTTLVYGTGTVQTIYAGAGYASSYNAGAPYDGTLPSPSTLNPNFNNNPLPDFGDTSNWLAINNVYPIVSGPSLPSGSPFGAQGYLAPNYKSYGGGASQDDSSPAQDGYWWCEYTDELPSNRAFKSTGATYTLPSGIPTNATHALISLVAPGSVTNSGDALLSYPVNVTGLAGSEVTFETDDVDLYTQVTIGTGGSAQLIKMFNPANPTGKSSSNDFDAPIETEGYTRVDRPESTFAGPDYIGLTINVPILTIPPSSTPNTFYIGDFVQIGATGDWDRPLPPDEAIYSAQGGIWAFNGIANYGLRNPGAGFLLSMKPPNEFNVKPGPNVVTYTIRGLTGTITIYANDRPYAIKDTQGTFVKEQNANYGAVGDPGTLDAAKPYYSIAFTYLTSFDSYAYSSQSVGNPNYTIDLSPDAFAGYKYLHVTLIGQGGTGHCGPGGGQGGLLEFYLDLDKAGRDPGLTFNLIPSETANPAKSISDTVFSYNGYTATAQCCQGQNSGGSTVISVPQNDDGAFILVQKLKGQDGVANGMPGGLSPQWQNLYIQSNPNFKPQFVGRTPYVKYPDKGNAYQCYGSGGQSNASFYTSTGPGNAYWSYELTNVLPTTGFSIHNGEGSTQNPIGNYFQNDGSIPNQSVSSDPIPLSARGTNRYLHYILIGPGDAGNGANNGGSGGYIDAYFDIGGSLVADPQYLNNITITFAQGLASQVTVTGDSSMNMIYTDPESGATTLISQAIAYGSKGLEGDTQFPIDQYTLIVKNKVGPRAPAPDKFAPDPLTLYGYLGPDNVMYGSGGSRGAGGSTYTFGQSGYYWYEFTNTINRKTSWNSNDDTQTYPSAVTFFNNYRYLHYVLIGGGMYGTTGVGGAGGALLEGYLDLTTVDRINSYLTIATGNYDFGDGRGPTNNSYLSFQNIEVDTVNISVALAEGGTAQAYNLGGTIYGPIDTDISGSDMRYTVVQRALYGHDSPLDTSKPAAGYLGMDGKTYGDGGQAHGIYHQQAGASYWWFEYTNEKPPPSNTSQSSLISIPIVQASNPYRYIHYIIIGAGNDSVETGGGGGLVEAYFDMKTAALDHPTGTYTLIMEKGAFSSGVSTPTTFRYKIANGSDISFVTAAAATDVSGGIPSGFDADPYTTCIRVLPGKNRQGNISSPGWPGQGSLNYGAGETTDTHTPDGHFWYSFTNKPPQLPAPPVVELQTIIEPPISAQALETFIPNPNVVPYFPPTESNPVATPTVWNPPPPPSLPPPPPPLGVTWDSNYNELSYPSFTKTFKGANFIHYVLIGAGQPAPAVIPPTVSNTISGENFSSPSFITLIGPAYTNAGDNFNIIAAGDWNSADGFTWKQDGVQNSGFQNPGSAWTAPSDKATTRITYLAMNGLEGLIDIPIVNPDYSTTKTRGGTTKPNYIKLNCPSTVFCGEVVRVVAEGDWLTITGTPWSFNNVINSGLTGFDAYFYAPALPGQETIKFTLNGLIGEITINVLAKSNTNTLGNSGAYVEGYIDMDQLPENAKIGAIMTEFGDPAFIVTDLSGGSIISATIIDATGTNNKLPSPDYTYIVSNKAPNAPANNAPGLGFKGLDGNTYGGGGGANNDPEPEQGYWGFELTNTIPFPKSWNSEINSGDYPKNIGFFNGKFKYLHYILIGGSQVVNNVTFEQGGLIEAYFDISGQPLGTIDFQEGIETSFTYSIGGVVGEAKINSYGNGTYPDPNSINVRGLNGQVAPVGQLQSFIGPDGLPKGSYWWFELTNSEPPPLPSDKTIAVGDSNNIPSESVTTTTNPNIPQPVTIPITGNDLKYLHYIIIGAGANGNQKGGAGSVVEAYVDLDKAKLSGPFEITFTKGLAAGEFQTSAFNLVGTDLSGNTIRSDAFAPTGDSNIGGQPMPPLDNFSYVVVSKIGGAPSSSAGGKGYESYDGTIYGAGGNADGNGSQAQNGYWWYELTNTAPLAQNWSSLNPAAVPTTTNFFNDYTFLHYILIGGGNTGFGNEDSGGGGGAYLEGYLDLTKAGTGVINFSLQQNGALPTSGQDAVFTYIGKYGNISQAVAGGGGAFTDVSGGTVILPYDLYTNVAEYSNGNEGNPVLVPGQAPPPAKGFLGPNKVSYGDGGTNYNNLTGGLYPGKPFWWFEFTSVKPPNPTSFDSTSGDYPTDLTGYSNFRYMRYVLIGAGSIAGGTGSIVDVFLDLDQVGRNGKLTLTQGNIDGSGVDTSIKFGESVVAQAGGTKNNIGGYAIAPKDNYSIVNNIQQGMSSDLSGNPLNQISTPKYIGFQGLNGNYYGGCDSLAAGIGYWGVEFSNRGPANNLIVHLADPVTPAPPVEPGENVPPQPLVIPIIVPKKYEQGASGNSGKSDLSGNIPLDLSGNISVDISGNKRAGASRVTMGVLAIPPITIPFADISGSFPPGVTMADLSGGLVANIIVQSKTNPTASGQTDLSGNPIEPVIKSTSIQVRLNYDPIGKPPDFKPGFVSEYTADPNLTLIDETGDITVQSSIATASGFQDVFSGAPSTTSAKPGLLEAKMKADILPYDADGKPLNDLSGNPTIELSGSGVTGGVNVQLKGLSGNFVNSPGAPITGTINIKISINKDPTIYTYTLPLQNNGNELVIAGSGNLNDITDVTSGPPPDFVNTILLTISGELITWQPSFNPLAPAGDYLPPRWTEGNTYAIYSIENTLAETYYKEYVYKPDRLAATTNSTSFDFNTLNNFPKNNMTLVVASTIDGMNFVYSNPVTTNFNTGIAIEKVSGGYQLSNSSGISTDPLYNKCLLCFSTDLTADVTSMVKNYNQTNSILVPYFFQFPLVDTQAHADLMRYPLQLTIVGYPSVSPGAIQDIAADFVYVPTPISISEPDINNKLTITLTDVSGADISGADISGAKLKPEPVSWNFTNTKALYGVYMSNDSLIKSEDITADLRNLVSQINTDKYQLPQAIGNQFANKFLVSTQINGKPYYSNYVIIDTGVYGGYYDPATDISGGKFYYSTNFTPVPIAIPEPGGLASTIKYNYVVYICTDITMTPAQIVARSKSVLNVGPGVKNVWAVGTDDPFITLESVTPGMPQDIKVVVSASPDGANVHFSEPSQFNKLNGAPFNISYDKANKSLTVPFSHEALQYPDPNLPAGTAPVYNVIYTVPVTGPIPPTIKFSGIEAWTYYDYLPVGAATYTFTKPLPTPCYLVVSYSTDGNAASETVVSTVLKFTSLTNVTSLAFRNRNYKYGRRPIKNKKRNKLYYAVSAAGGAPPQIGPGDGLSVYGFNLGISNGAQYSLNFPNPISYYAACLLKGTTLLTPNGYVNIEALKVGDLVISHRNRPVKVLSVGVWRIEWTENIAASDLVYKVANGVLGAEKPLYISAYHRILYNGEMETANAANLPLAKKEEVCEPDGFYTYYNVMVENHTMNNLVVNGGVVVESWDGKYPEEAKDAPLILNPYATRV